MKTMLYTCLLAITITLAATAVNLAIDSSMRVLTRHSLNGYHIPDLPEAATFITNH